MKLLYPPPFWKTVFSAHSWCMMQSDTCEITAGRLTSTEDWLTIWQIAAHSHEMCVCTVVCSQYTAVHCRVLSHSTRLCTVVCSQYTAVPCRVLSHSTWLCTVVCSQYTAVHCRVLSHGTQLCTVVCWVTVHNSSVFVPVNAFKLLASHCWDALL